MNDEELKREESVTAESAESTESAATAEDAKKINRVDKFFGISKSGSTFKTEIIAGITTLQCSF